MQAMEWPHVCTVLSHGISHSRSYVNYPQLWKLGVYNLDCHFEISVARFKWKNVNDTCSSLSKTNPKMKVGIGFPLTLPSMGRLMSVVRAHSIMVTAACWATVPILETCNIYLFLALGFPQLYLLVNARERVIALPRRHYRSHRGIVSFCGLWLWRYLSLQWLLSSACQLFTAMHFDSLTFSHLLQG